MSGEDRSNDPPQPRQPQNLQGLFRFALEATRAEDAPNPSEFEEMDEERRKFLEDALKSMTIDIVEQLNKAMKVLMEKQDSEDELVDALETVSEFVENMDTANDFYKIGGFSILIPCLDSKFISVRMNTCSLISELAQNNPFCQKHLQELDILPKLIYMIQDTPDIAKSAMHAVSCMIRNYEPAIAAFIEIGGLECTLACLHSDNDKLVIRTAFLMAALCTEFEPVRDEYVKLNAIEKVVSIIKPVDKFDSKLETALSVLETLVRGNKMAIEHCQSGSLNLKSTLETILASNEGKPECSDQIEYCNTIMTACFGTCKENADR